MQVTALQQKRLQLGLPEQQAGDDLVELAAGRTSGLTPHRLKAFLSLCRQRYELKGAEPGQFHSSCILQSHTIDLTIYA